MLCVWGHDHDLWTRVFFLSNDVARASSTAFSRVTRWCKTLIAHGTTVEAYMASNTLLPPLGYNICK